MCFCVLVYFFFFFKQKTAYEMRISDWSSDVCSSDLRIDDIALRLRHLRAIGRADEAVEVERLPRDVAHELHPLHRHARIPEEEDVEAGDEDVVGVVALEQLGILGPAERREGPESEIGRAHV